MSTFFGPYFHFCLELALETWVKASSAILSGVHDLDPTHSLVSFQWFSDQQTLILTENSLKCQKWSPYKGKEIVSTPNCANKVRNGSGDQGHSAASRGSILVVLFGCTLVSIQYNAQSHKIREGLGTLITWLTSGGREVDTVYYYTVFWFWKNKTVLYIIVLCDWGF